MKTHKKRGRKPYSIKNQVYQRAVMTVTQEEYENLLLYEQEKHRRAWIFKKYEDYVMQYIKVKRGRPKTQIIKPIRRKGTSSHALPRPLEENLWEPGYSGNPYGRRKGQKDIFQSSKRKDRDYSYLKKYQFKKGEVRNPQGTPDWKERKTRNEKQLKQKEFDKYLRQKTRAAKPAYYFVDGHNPPSLSGFDYERGRFLTRYGILQSNSKTLRVVVLDAIKIVDADKQEPSIKRMIEMVGYPPIEVDVHKDLLFPNRVLNKVLKLYKKYPIRNKKPFSMCFLYEKDIA